MISLIVAMDNKGAIGKDGSLPWHLPEDLKRFKAITEGSTVIMGRKTWDSLPIKPLPNRDNIIVTRERGYEADGAMVCKNLDYMKGLMSLNKEMQNFIIGGQSIYDQFCDIADILHLTFIDHDFGGDTFFNCLDDSWELIEEEKGVKNEKNPYDYYFYTYKKRGV